MKPSTLASRALSAPEAEPVLWVVADMARPFNPTNGRPKFPRSQRTVFVFERLFYDARAVGLAALGPRSDGSYAGQDEVAVEAMRTRYPRDLAYGTEYYRRSSVRATEIERHFAGVESASSTDAPRSNAKSRRTARDNPPKKAKSKRVRRRAR